MSYFHNLLVVEKIKVRPKPVWKLVRDLVYESDLYGGIITVPHGFQTDFASVPRLPLAFMLAGGKADEAAVVHDLLYTTKAVPRKVADAIFHEAIATLGYSGFTSSIMYAGVRLGGGFVWNRDRLRQYNNVQETLDSHFGSGAH